MLAAAGLALVLTACAAAAIPSAAPSPTVAPTPLVTPDPHLEDPATADAILKAIAASGLPLSVSNAIGGDPRWPFVKRFNAAVDNWPLIVTEYKNRATLRAAIHWDRTKPVFDGNPPYTFIGLNILITFGPAAARATPPDANRQAEARQLIGVLDPLLWPIEERALIPLPSRTAMPARTPAASAASPKPGTTATSTSRP
jgi:hypothetical protein